jgi:hypothetical protein
VQLFIPAKNKKEAERGAPPWACLPHRVRGRVQGWFIVFDREEALQNWKVRAHDRH